MCTRIKYFAISLHGSDSAKSEGSAISCAHRNEISLSCALFKNVLEAFYVVYNICSCASLFKYFSAPPLPRIFRFLRARIIVIF